MNTELVELRGGLIVPGECIAFLIGLENRGISCQADQGTLRVRGAGGAKPELSESDVAFIKARKGHLLALAAYQAPAIP